MGYSSNPRESCVQEVAYVAGPYRSDTESGLVRNIRLAEAIALGLWRKGYAVICPHKNTAHFGGACPDSVWLKGDIAMMLRCDLVVMVPGWRDSEGARAEARAAIAADIPVWEMFTSSKARKAVTEVPA